MPKDEIPWEQLNDLQRQEETKKFVRLLRDKPKELLEWCKGKTFGTHHQKIHEEQNRKI